MRDLDHRAVTAFLQGREDDCVRLLTASVHHCTERGDPVSAARSAFWLAFTLLQQGIQAPAAGWLARARRLLDDAGADAPELGYLLLPEGLEALGRGQPEAARTAFDRAAAVGTRFGDADLLGLARQGQGRAHIRLGERVEGLRLLDEVMASAVAGDLSPVVAGIVYCGVVAACLEIFDTSRAQEWTAAFSRWCEAQPDLVAFRGQCLTRRAEVRQLRGEWSAALAEAREACERLAARTARSDLGAAWYRTAELLRLRGAFDESAAAYAEVMRCGRRPEPGLALLHLARGRTAAAWTAMRRALEEADGWAARAPLLSAGVSIALAADAHREARSAAAELDGIARRVATPYLRAAADAAAGAVLLAERHAAQALAPLRRAWEAWERLDAPYEAARTRVLLAEACDQLGDAVTAGMERAAARQAFERLGAAPEVAALDRPRGGPHALTGRERQVLTLVAGGGTNRGVADALGISEKTVARHLSNIFTKIGVASRAAATAYAYEHGLIDR